MAATLTDWLRNLRGRLPDAETDAELLRRFGSTRDEEAFASLVARHGPMVFGVCRRVLGHTTDAEDAFQAVFVILAVKADAVARIGKVGGWLHGVAFHTARKARDRRFRRSSDTSDLLDLIPTRDDTHDPDADHLREKLDEVLAGLPEKYRVAVVLCELEQMSRAEAAGRLGWTEGTLSGRLARARKLLADRLTRRGVAVGTLLAAGLSARPLTASVPAKLAASAISVAKLVSSGLPLPAGLATLAHGVTHAMLLNRIKLTAAGLVAAGLLATGIGSLWADSVPSKPLAASQAAPAPKPAAEWKVKHTIKHAQPVTAVAFGADLIASGDADGNLTLWDATTGKEKEKLVDVVAFDIPNKAAVTGLAFKPDSEWLYITHMDGTGLSACRLAPKMRLFPGFGGPDLKMFGFSPDGDYFLHAQGSTLSAFKNTFPDNMINGQRDAYLKAERDIAFAAITPDNGKIILVTDQNTICGYGYGFDPLPLWAVADGGLKVTSLALSPDNTFGAVAAKDGTVRLFECATGSMPAALKGQKDTANGMLKGHKGAANAVCFSPDSKHVASAGDDHTIRVWDVTTGKTIATLKGHTDAVKSVAFSPDGTMLVSGSSDKTVKVWQLGK